EAVAVRDLIRHFRAGTTGPLAADLPDAAREICKQHEAEVAAIRKRAEAEFAGRQEKMAAGLQKVQDQLCKEAKLDEAVAVRDMIRAIRDGVANPLPDPGRLIKTPADIGKVFYYEVTGVTDQILYGTDVYATASHIGTVAVHCGLLKVGETGVV